MNLYREKILPKQVGYIVDVVVSDHGYHFVIQSLFYKSKKELTDFLLPDGNLVNGSKLLAGWTYYEFEFENFVITEITENGDRYVVDFHDDDFAVRHNYTEIATTGDEA